MSTVFHKIVSGEIPCHRVYEDAQVLAFLDVSPLSRGHMLVIPKQPAATLGELPDEYGAAIGRVLPRLCRAVMRATGAKAYNVLQNNGSAAHQAVFYVHFHIIPKYPDGRGLGIGWSPQSLSQNEGELLAKQIAAQL